MADKNRKVRLDQYLVQQKLVASRHQAADLIRRRQVKVNKEFLIKPAHLLDLNQRWRIQIKQTPYASRAGEKLAGASSFLKLNFSQKVVLDVGAHRGGFTDYALRHGAKSIIALDVGNQALIERLLNKPQVLNLTKTDIRHFQYPPQMPLPDYILLDLSFISLTKVLDSLRAFCQEETIIVALVKPQFEAQREFLNKGVVKNQTYRRRIFSDFETWLQENRYLIIAKVDAVLPGLKGNLERFYAIKPWPLQN